MRLFLVLALSLFSVSSYSYWDPGSTYTLANCKSNGVFRIGQGNGVTAYRCDLTDHTIAGVPQYRLVLWRSTESPCPSGQEWNQQTFQCEGPPEPEPDCSDTSLQGDVWDSASESCVCPAGTIDVLTPTGYRCSLPEAPIPECKANDPAFRGYMNNTPICDWGSQCPPGHSGGLVDGKWRCIETPPDCNPGQLYVNGSCIGPSTDEGGQSPGDGGGDDEGPGSGDGGGDGDGSGSGNGNSPSSPGNAPGPGHGTEHFSDDNEEGTFAQASGSCSIRPSCKGDSAQCAILLQEWYNGCKAETSEFGAPIAGDGTESWFVSDYPDGFAGIWESKRQSIEDGAMVSWLGSWGVASSGTCPAFNIDLNLGFINFGSFNLLNGWCYIFDFIRICVLITAAFLCRSLIFGG